MAKQVKFLVLWKLEPNDEVEFEADVMATSYRDARKQFLIIPVPKSNPVVGPASDLVGINSSHKGNR